MKFDVHSLTVLRQLGVSEVTFSDNDKLRAVKFFPPQSLEEQRMMQIVSQQLERTPEAIAKELRVLELDETLSEEDRNTAVRKLKNELYYASSD